MNQGQVIPISDALLVLLRTCRQYLDSDKELEAKVTYGNVMTLAMVYGSSDEVVREIFAVAMKLPGAHPELHFFAKRATHEELAQLYQHQEGHTGAALAIRKASRPNPTPPLLG